MAGKCMLSTQYVVALLLIVIDGAHADDKAPQAGAASSPTEQLVIPDLGLRDSTVVELGKIDFKARYVTGKQLSLLARLFDDLGDREAGHHPADGEHDVVYLAIRIKAKAPFTCALRGLSVVPIDSAPANAAAGVEAAQLPRMPLDEISIPLDLEDDEVYYLKLIKGQNNGLLDAGEIKTLVSNQWRFELRKVQFNYKDRRPGCE